MKILFIAIFTLLSGPAVLFDFTADSTIANWYIVDDVVMGGRSKGNFFVNEQGHGVFRGNVSLENNGGFSSVRHVFKEKQVSSFQKFVIRVKGDGKRYQFRVKTDWYDRHSYVAYFDTSSDWQTIEIAFSDMVPTFRGYKLNIPNYPGSKMEEIAFLISNKRGEDFKLEIDRIDLK